MGKIRIALCGHEYEGTVHGRTRARCDTCVTSNPPPPRPCEVPGCEQPHRAKGLCVRHYRQVVGRQERPRSTSCVVCGRQVVRSPGRKHQPTCSTECRRRLQFGISEPLPKYHMARWVGQSMPVEYSECDGCGGVIAQDARQHRKRHASCTRPRIRFVSGWCACCGESYIADRQAFHGHAMYCSDRCAASRVRMRRRQGDKRPGWRRIAELQGDLRCHICGDDCDPDDYERRDGTFIAGITYPSVDHIHPLSRGGSNDLDNLAIAHMLCNSWKSNSLAA